MLHNPGPGTSIINDDNSLVRGNTSSDNGFFPDGSYGGGTGNGIGIQSGLNVTDNNTGNGIAVQCRSNQILGDHALGNGVYDLFDNNANCANNVWSGNIHGVWIQPACTGDGGQHVATRNRRPTDGAPCRDK